MAKQGLRTFMYAYKEMRFEDFGEIMVNHNDFKTMEDRKVLEEDLVFVIAFGLEDQLREGVEDAIKSL